MNVEKRSNMYTANGSGILTNSDDITYYSSLTLGGKEFSVLIDTGQSLSLSLCTSQSVCFLSFADPAVALGCRKVNPAFDWRSRP